VGTEEALELFDALPAVDTADLPGRWRGEEFPTGHPMDGALAAYHWQGKRFDSEEHAHPLLFGTTMREFAVRPRWAWPGVPLVMRWHWLKTERVAMVVRSLLPLLATRRSQARLRTIEFRGRPGAAMVYDDLPIQDVFRRIDEDTVLGLMDWKGMERPYFFILRRRRGQGAPSP
jgi:hypothetical protein